MMQNQRLQHFLIVMKKQLESGQVMDNGKITGSNGKEADARNCILILTTNLGAADSEKNTIGFGGELEDNSYEDKALHGRACCTGGRIA